MKITAIAARSANNIIGIKNRLPWHLPADLKFFRAQTMGKYVIMGRKSFESLPGPLKGRSIITVTRSSNYFHSNCVVKNSIPEALSYAMEKGAEEVMILGGGIIYQATMPLWDRMILTDVDVNIEGDTSFVDLNLEDWDLEFEEEHQADEKNKYNYTFRIYNRVNDHRSVSPLPMEN